jgi:hypothetical protein
MHAMSDSGRLAAVALALAISVAVGGCSAANKEGQAETFRSPSRDYPLPRITTSDGEQVGADRTPADDKLQTNPRVGPGGPSAAAGSPKPESTSDGRPSPCAEIGLEDASGKSPCKKPVKAPPATAPRGP